MTRRRKIVVGAAVAAAALVLGTRPSVIAWFRPTPEQRALEEKLNNPDTLRILTYPVARGQPLTMALLPQDQELKLLTNLEVGERAVARPAALAADLAAGQRPELVYGLRVTYLDAAGHAIQTADYWEKSTKTRVRDPGAAADREEAFFAQGETTPCDTRATYLLVRDLVARGAVAVRISIEGEAGALSREGGAGDHRPAELEPSRAIAGREISFSPADRRRTLVRCLRSVDLTREEAIERWTKMTEEKRDEALREVNLYKADLVSEAERIELMRRQWQVVPALGENGAEHPTVPVYFNTKFFQTFEPPRDELFHAALAGPLRTLALNLVGPLNLWIEVVRDPDASIPAPIGAEDLSRGPPLLEIVGLREDGIFFSRLERLEPGPGGEPRAPIHLPLAEGPATLYCRPVNFRARVRFYVDRANSLEGSEVTKVVSPVGERERYLEVRPEMLATNYYDASGPESLPIEAEVVHARPRAGEAGQDAGGAGGAGDEVAEVRIAARVPVDPGVALAAPRPFEIVVEMLGADGRLVAKKTLTGLAEASFFDSYWRELEEQKLVSEPSYFTLRCPREVRRLRVRAKERVDVAFYSRLRSGEDVTYVPEDYPRTPEIRVSEIFAGKLRGKTWFYYRPVNQFELAAVGREVRVEVERRLFEPRERVREAYEISNFARSLEPRAAGARFRVVEPGATDGARIVLGRPNARFLVRPGTDETVALADPIDPLDPRPLPVTLRYAPVAGKWGQSLPTLPGSVSATSQAGQSPFPREALVFAYVDGRRALEGPLAAGGGGVLDLGAFPQGERRLRVEVYSRAAGESAYHLEEDPPFRFFVDHPVREGAPGGGAAPRLAALHYEREAFPLGPAAPLELEVEKAGVEPVVLNCVLFAPRPERRAQATGALASGAALAAAGPRDEILVDVARVGRGPGGRETVEPVESRRLSVKRPVDGAAFAEDDAGRSVDLGPGQRFFVAVRTEFEPGRYRLSFRRAPDAGVAPPAGDLLLLRVAAVDPARARISRERFARLNLKGPVRVLVELDPGELAPGVDDVRLLVKVVPGDRELRELIVRRDPKTGAFAATLDAPAGLRTMIVGTLAAPLTARFSIDRPVDAIAGIYALSIPEDVRERPWLEVLPDTAEAVMHRVAPGEPPIAYAVPAGEAPLLRVSTAIPLAQPSEVEPVPYAYAVAFRDAGGEILSRTTVTATATFARASFDRADGGAAVPSEADAQFIVPPAGAAAMLVSATSVPLYVEVERELAGPAHVYTPLDFEREAGIRRVDLAHLDERYAPVDPIEAEALARGGRRTEVASARARVREVVEPPPATGFAEALVPIDYGARWKLLEPLPKGAVADPAAWTDALYAQVRANDRVRFAVRDFAAPPTATASAPPPGDAPWLATDVPVYFDFGEAGVAGEIAAIVDGKRLAAFVPVESHGRFTVKDVPLGARDISFSAAPGATFYVGAPPAEPASFRPLRERVVSRLEEARPLEIVVVKRAGGDLVVNGALYLEGMPAPGAELEVALEAAGPARRRGVALPEATRLVHRFHLGEAEGVTLLDLDRFAIETARVFPFFVPLKADLPDGEYRAKVTLRGAKEGAVRFLVLRAEAPIVERARAAVLRRD